METFDPVFERWMDVSLAWTVIFTMAAIISPCLFTVDHKAARPVGVALIAVGVIAMVYRTWCYIIYGL